MEWDLPFLPICFQDSCEVVTLAASYLKLANYENRNVDIESLVYAWTVYYQRKDYSVYTMEDALIVFENEKIIDEDESFEIISKLMEQSEKGISHLLTSYVNQKGDMFIKKLIKRGYFSDSNNAIRFWELDSALLNCFDKAEMSKQLTDLLRYHYNSKNIDFRDLFTVMQSKYKNMMFPASRVPAQEVNEIEMWHAEDWVRVEWGWAKICFIPACC